MDQNRFVFEGNLTMDNQKFSMVVITLRKLWDSIGFVIKQ